MTILADDLHLYAAERMTDLDNGGGLPSGNRVLDGLDNAVFPDIASGDRIAGRTYARKLFAAVNTSDTDTLMAARAYLASLPGDPDVSYALMQTGSFSDERADMVEHLYTAAQKDINTNFRLFETYNAGDSYIALYGFSNQNAPTYMTSNLFNSFYAVGMILCLEDGDTQQYVRITDVSHAKIFNSPDWFYSLNITFSPPLTATFRGGYDDEVDYVTPTQIYTTRPVQMNAGIYGITTLTAPATTADYHISVADLRAPIAPTLMQIFEGSFQGSEETLPVTLAVTPVNSRIQSTTIDPMPDLADITVRYPYGGGGQQSIAGAVSPALFTVAGTTISVLLPVSPVRLAQYSHTPTPTVITATSAALRWFRPLTAGTITVRATESVSGTYRVTADDGVGVITGTNITGTVDYEAGEIDLTFAVAMDLTTLLVTASAPETRIVQGQGAATATTLDGYFEVHGLVDVTSVIVSARRVSDNVLLNATTNSGGVVSGTDISGTVSAGRCVLTFGSLVYANSIRLTYSATTALNQVLGLDYAPASSYSVTLPLYGGQFSPGSLVVSGYTYPEKLYRSANDDGEGAISGTGITGTLNNGTGALSLTFADDLLRSSITVRYAILGATGDILWQYDTQASGTAFTLALPEDLLPESITVQAAKVSDASLVTGADDGEGAISGTGISGTVDYAAGQATLTFSEAVTSASLQMLYRYTAPSTVTPAMSDSLDWLRIPASRSFPMFRPGDGIRLHYPLADVLPNPVTPSGEYALSRDQVSQIWLEDSSGIRIPTALYQVDRVGGVVTMAASLDLSMYTQPLVAWHSIDEEATVIVADEASQRLELDHVLRHAFPAEATRVSGLVPLGDLFASASVPFAQQAWTSVWSDELIGSEITPQFNNTVYPIEVTNDGAITERWRIQFTAATTVNVIGEVVGQIATNLSITSDIAPINPATGHPYFTIPYEGWGAGWVSGNLLRLNTTAAQAPFWIIGCIQPGESPLPGTPDRFHIAFTGDVDA